MNKSEVFDLMIEIKKNYPIVDVSDDEINRHYKHLRDFPFDVALKNLDDYVKVNGFPPKISDIRGKLGDLMDSQRGKERAATHEAQLVEWSQNNTPPPDGYWESVRSKLRGDKS